jgi:hypothetical protein
MDGFIGNFCLAVALRVVQQCSEVIGAKPFKQFVRQQITKFFALIGTMSIGAPKQQYHLSKMAFATVAASLFWSGTNSTYFARASVMYKINFLPPSEVFNSSNRLACTRWFGSVG